MYTGKNRSRDKCCFVHTDPIRFFYNRSNKQLNWEFLLKILNNNTTDDSVKENLKLQKLTKERKIMRTSSKRIMFYKSRSFVHRL